MIMLYNDCFFIFYQFLTKYFHYTKQVLKNLLLKILFFEATVTNYYFFVYFPKFYWWLFLLNLMLFNLRLDLQAKIYSNPKDMISELE